MVPYQPTLHHRLFEAFKRAYPYRAPKDMQCKATEYWNEIKTKDNYILLFNQKIEELSNIKKQSILSYFKKSQTKSQESTESGVHKVKTQVIDCGQPITKSELSNLKESDDSTYQSRIKTSQEKYNDQSIKNQFTDPCQPSTSESKLSNLKESDDSTYQSRIKPSQEKYNDQSVKNQLTDPCQPSTSKSELSSWTESSNDSTTQSKPKPAQEKCNAAILWFTSEIEKLEKKINNGVGDTNDSFQLKSMKTKLKVEKRKLKRLQDGMRYSQKSRLKVRHKLLTLRVQYPEILSSVHLRPGRPSLESKYPNLLEAITNIVRRNLSVEEKKETAHLETSMTLDELHNELKNSGYHLSRTALYHRLLPKEANSAKGNVTGVLVKLTTTKKRST